MEDSSQTEMISEQVASRLRLEALRLFEQRQRQVTLRASGVGMRPIDSIPVLRAAFYAILKRYNSAIIDNLTKLKRHEMSLRAWKSVLEEMEMPQEVMLPLFWDYVEPVLFMALDLPTAVKEQVTRATVSLNELADRGVDGLEKVIAWDGDRNYGWIRCFKGLSDDSYEFQVLKKAVDQLFEPHAAEELRNDHGRRYHAVPQRIGVGYPRIINTASVEDDFLSLEFGFDEPLDLDEKLELIETQRLRAERAYDALWSYVQYLEKRGLAT